MPLTYDRIPRLPYWLIAEGTPTVGQVPTYDPASDRLVFDDGGGGFEVFGTPTGGQVPKWNDTEQRWEPGDDLTATPGLAVQSDWTSTDDTNAAFILHKPTLFDGAYGSLSGRPPLFSGTYADLTGSPNLSDFLSGPPTISGQVLSFPQYDGSSAVVTLPTSGGGGGTQVNTDWDATSGLAELLNKPDLSDVLAGISSITGNTLTFDEFGGGTTSVNLPERQRLRR